MDLKKGEFFKCCAIGKNLPKANLPEVIFVGRSNVGKSSIINCLLNRKKIAKISSRPGKTSTINFYKVGNAFLVDFPGYGFSKVSQEDKIRWNNLINVYFNGKRIIKLAVLVVDCRRNFLDLDLDMVNFFLEKNLSFIVVLSKVDKLSKLSIDKHLKFLKENCDNVNFLKLSTKTRVGLYELKETILNYVNKLGG